MTIYCVNRTHYFRSLKKAIEHAKIILTKRCAEQRKINKALKTIINPQYKITQGKKGGYCVKLLEDWTMVGNPGLLNVTISTHELDMEEK